MHIKVLGSVPKKLMRSFVHILGNNRSNEIVLFCDYSEFDIPLGTIFNEIIEANRVNPKHEKCLLELKSVTQQFMLEYEKIPKGHKTICKFEFQNGIPEIVNRLPAISEWGISENALYFMRNL